MGERHPFGNEEIKPSRTIMTSPLSLDHCIRSISALVVHTDNFPFESDGDETPSGIAGGEDSAALGFIFRASIYSLGKLVSYQ